MRRTLKPRGLSEDREPTAEPRLPGLGSVIVCLVLVCLALTPVPAFALEPNEYRQFMGLDSRKLIWFLAQLHLFFGAFVLGVP
jgi:hypothetical protein